jgi:hypothetical protein
MLISSDFFAQLATAMTLIKVLSRAIEALKNAWSTAHLRDELPTVKTC